MTIKAVIFDLDDTLWPIMPVIKRAEDHLYAWLLRNAPTVASRVSIDGMRRRRQELMATDPLYQLDLRMLRRAVLLEAFIDAGEDIAMVESAMEVFSRARNEVQPYPDVLPVLQKLRGKLALGTVSNGVADLDAIGISHFFDISIAAYHFGRAKPDPVIFHAACEALAVEPGEALYVGDDPLLDVQGAQRAGLRTAWVNRPDHEPLRQLPENLKPDITCGSLHELDQWLTEFAVKP